MLQPKRREQLDANIKELLANGGSNQDIEKMAADFTSKFGNEVPLKKKTFQILFQKIKNWIRHQKLVLRVQI